ncbi:hypothetical protein Tco_1473438 [Tanacetum coccineum]
MWNLSLIPTRTITPTELKRTESLLPLELSNRFSILSALLVSHGTKMNSRYTALVASKARSREKLKRNAECITELRSEVLMCRYVGLEVGSIRRIQGIGYGVLEFLGVGTTFDIFQNLNTYDILLFWRIGLSGVYTAY